jgi:hypothetical protein
MVTLFFLFTCIRGSGLFRHVTGRLRSAVDAVSFSGGPEGKKRGFRTVCVALVTVLLSLTFTSCGALIYDLLEGGKASGGTHTLTVDYDYSGTLSISSGAPIFVAVFGSEFSGSEPDLVYLSQPLDTRSGSCSFPDLEERTYGVLVFVDSSPAVGEPSSGEFYAFYDGVADSPTEIFLGADTTVQVVFGDSYRWVEGFQETFDDAVADGWKDDGTGRWLLDGYRYTMYGDYSGNIAYSYYEPQEFQDFTCRVTVGRSDGDLAGRAGLFFRAGNPTGINGSALDGYVLWIDGNGNWSLDVYVSGNYPQNLISESSLYLNKGLGTSNDIEVSCSGRTISVFFNGSQVAQKTDNSFSSGKIGVACEDFTGWASASVYWFDDLAVY